MGFKLEDLHVCYSDLLNNLTYSDDLRPQTGTFEVDPSPSDFHSLGESESLEMFEKFMGHGVRLLLWIRCVFSSMAAGMRMLAPLSRPSELSSMCGWDTRI